MSSETKTTTLPVEAKGFQGKIDIRLPLNVLHVLQAHADSFKAAKPHRRSLLFNRIKKDLKKLPLPGNAIQNLRTLKVQSQLNSVKLLLINLIFQKGCRAWLVGQADGMLIPAFEEALMAKWPERVEARAKALGETKRTVQSINRIVADVLSGLTNGDKLRLGFYSIRHMMFKMGPL